MDYRALAELVLMALLGLSALVVAMGFSVKFFLAPVLRDLFARSRGPSDLPPDAKTARLAHMEDRLDAIERDSADWWKPSGSTDSCRIRTRADHSRVTGPELAPCWRASSISPVSIHASIRTQDRDPLLGARRVRMRA